MSRQHLAIVGPTASGKSALGMEVARRFGDVEIVVADSMQGYAAMDIGTAKPSPDEQRQVPHHLVDVVEPSQEYSLPQFLELARAAIAGIESRGRRALLVGGTGLYVQALLDGYDVPGTFPEARDELDSEPDTAALYRRLGELDHVAQQKIEPGNRRRIVRALEVTLGSGRPFSSYEANLPAPSFDVVGLWLPRDENAERIEQRIQQMMRAGWLEETRRLLEGPPLSKTAAKALGYSDLIEVLAGNTSEPEAVEAIAAKTKAFARRQRVWFRRDRRVRWFGASQDRRLVTRAVLADLADSAGKEEVSP